MTELDLFDELTFIDDDLILEAHKSPARKTIHFRGLRKAAVLVAAVMLMVITVCARDWSLNPSLLITSFDGENHGYIMVSDGVWRMVDHESFYLDHQEISYRHSQVFTQDELQYHVECDGIMLRATLEAMILMEDGRMEYKQMELTDADHISLLLDNYVAEEAGIIINVRNRVLYEFDDGWGIVYERYCYLPSQLRFEIPYGVDPRFPDMQYNYDGRGE